MYIHQKMDYWSNIEVSASDSEIIAINNFESTIGNLSEPVRKIRELITRFEVCHFKYKQHLRLINDSIIDLKPCTDPGKIGSNHISKGDNAWVNDRTGRSLIGQQYLWVLENWLTTARQDITPAHYDTNLDLRIPKWLGGKTPDKVRIVRLLIARLTYDWESYNKLQQGGQFKELEFQACRMDICHYAFPGHLDALIRAIGEMKPQKDPEGCGSYNSEIKDSIKGIFSELCTTIQDLSRQNNLPIQNKDDRVRIWLFACLAKTLKEQTGMADSLPDI